MGVQGLRKFIGAMSCTKTIYPREPKRTGGGSRSHSAPANLSSSASPAAKNQSKDNEMQVRVAAQVETIFRGQQQQQQGKADAKGQTPQTTTITNSVVKVTAAAPVTPSNGSATPTATGRLPTAQHVLFDLNSVIHSCFNKLEGAMSTPQNTIDAVKARIEEILTTIVCPTRTLTICIDGPAPLAKIRTQRLRRRRVSTVNMAHSKQFSELSITAGSSFMVKLEREVALFLQNRYADLFGKQNASSHNNPHHRKVEIYLHGSTSAGEGESKISQMLAFHAYNPNTPFNPNDTVVIIGNDIDLTLTAMGCMYYHNTFVLSPSALQAFCVGDIIYRWLCPGSGFLQDAHYLPSARADLIYLFSLNGGDHFPGVGEAAADLWRRYKLLRSTNPSRMIVSEDLLSVDLGFLGDILQVNEYEGQADPSVGLTLLRAALWATFTIVTGTCPDYRYTVPDTLLPSVSNLKAAIVANRTRSNACTIKYNPNAAPLTPLATYTAVMPTLEMFPDGALKALNTLPNNTKVNVRTLQAVHGGGGGGEDGGNNVSYRLQPVNLTLETIKKQLANVNDTNLIVSGVEGLLKMATDHGFLTPAEAARNNFTPPVHITSPSAERQKKTADLRKEIGRGRLPENIKRKKEDELKALMAEGPSFEIQPIHVRQPTNLGAATNTNQNTNNNYGGRNPATAGGHPPLTIDDNYYRSIRELIFTNIFNYSVNASFDDFEAAANAKIAAREAAAAAVAANDDFIMDDESPEAMMVAEEMNSFDRLLKRHTTAATNNAAAKHTTNSNTNKNTTAAAAASAATVLSAKTTIGSNVVRRIPVVQEIPEHLRAIREKAVKIQNKDKMQRDFTNMLKGKRDREVADDDDNTRHKSNKDGSAAAAKKGARVEGVDGAAVSNNKKNNTGGNKKGGRGMEDDEDYDSDAMADLDIDDDDDDDGGANTRKGGSKKGSKKASASKKKGRSLADLSDDDDDGGFAGAFVDDYSDDEAGGFDDGFGAGSKTMSSKKKKSGGVSGKRGKH